MRVNSKEKYWVIDHDADCTETGMPQRRTYLKTIWCGHSSHQTAEKEIIQDWCRERFGSEVVYVQGVSPTKNWAVCPCMETHFNEAEGIVWGGYYTETQVVELEIGYRGTTKIIREVTIPSRYRHYRP
jgi:hypothetical protein